METLEQMTVEDWITRLQQTSKKIVESRVKNSENYWVSERDSTYRRHPYLAFKTVVKMAVNINRRNRINV